MSESRPKVVVVMATYEPNIDYLKQQLNSIRGQDYPNLNLIVVDDGSSEKNLQSIRLEVERVGGVFIETNENLGVVSNFERGLRKSLELNADLIAFSDQDDVWDLGKISVLVKRQIETKSDLVHCDMRVVSAQNKLIHSSVFDLERRRKKIDYLEQVFLVNTVTGCSMLVTRSCAESSLPFPKVRAKNPEFYHDQWLAICAFLGGGIQYVDKCLQSYRQHDQNLVGAQIGSKTVAGKIATLPKLSRNIAQSKSFLLSALSIKVSKFNFYSRKLNFYELRNLFLWKLGSILSGGES